MKDKLKIAADAPFLIYGTVLSKSFRFIKATPLFYID